MKKVIIASDSTTDLTKELINKYDIRILPLSVNLGEQTFLDGVDIDPDAIYENYNRTGELPKTSAINLAQFYKFFDECKKEAESVVFMTISADMSSTFNNARTVSLDYDDIYVVDTRNLSTGGGLMVLKAAEMALNGMDGKQIAEELEKLAPKIDASFVINDLEYLTAGGRVSALKAGAAAFFNIKPCIMVRDGKMVIGRKYHGKFKMVVKKYVNDVLENSEDIDPQFAFLTHSGVDSEFINEVYQQIKEKNIFENIFISRAGCTISSHCGPDTLGVLFIRKQDIAI